MWGLAQAHPLTKPSATRKQPSAGLGPATVHSTHSGVGPRILLYSINSRNSLFRDPGIATSKASSKYANGAIKRLMRECNSTAVARGPPRPPRALQLHALRYGLVPYPSSPSGLVWPTLQSSSLLTIFPSRLSSLNSQRSYMIGCSGSCT